MKLNMHLILLLTLLSLLSACTTQVKEKPKVAKPVVSAPAEEAVPVVIKQPTVPDVLPLPELIPDTRQDVLILLSSSANAYQKIADTLTAQLAEHAVQITLSGLPAQDRAVLEDIKASNTRQIVAIGLKAVNAVKGFENKQIIYTQVISHKNLIADNIKAVSSLPSPEKLFKDWKMLFPGLTKVAVITGKDLDRYLTRAKEAARAQGIELIVEQVNSDKGFIYKSKKLKSDVGGQWILPDNRVLSGKALKDVMAYSSRRGRQIVVFSPKLLSFGGFFYISPDLDAISQGVLTRLSELSDKGSITGNDVLPVLSHNMGINQNIARQFNLTIPQNYRKYINGQ